MKNNAPTFRNFLLGFALSFLFHLFIFQWIVPPFISFLRSSRTSTYKALLEGQERKEKEKRIDLVQIRKEDLEKIRTVGKKDGKKDIFNLPLNPFYPPPSPFSPAKEKTPVLKTKKERIKLSNLGTLDSQQAKESTFSQFSPAKEVKYRRKNPPSFQEYFDTKIGQYSDMFKVNPGFFKSSDFKIVLETPEGVEIDKLNSIEMIFYSFHKRVFEAYISSIFKAYEEFKIRNPHLDLAKFGKQTLKAKVQYDDDGNIKKIIDIKTSDSYHIQEFFRSILDDNRIPNPPKDILNKDGGFNLEFQLILNA